MRFAEEIGRSLTAIPFVSSAYLASRAVLLSGNDAQKRRWLPRLAGSSLIGCLALAEGLGAPSADRMDIALHDGRLDGTKQPVVDGGVASLAVVATGETARMQAGRSVWAEQRPGIHQDAHADGAVARTDARA